MDRAPSPAFFRQENERYIPNQKAVSAWNPNQLGGTALCALLARQLDTQQPGGDFTPARFTADLFSPVSNTAISLRSRIVRDSNRIRVVTADIVQNDEVRSRGTAQFLKKGLAPDGDVWEPERNYSIPGDILDDVDGSLPLFKYGDEDWTHDFSSGVNKSRKSVWVNVPPLVEGEPITAFERSAFVADFSNLVGNWGTAGIGYINTDVTLTMARLPRANELGMQAIDHFAVDGISACVTRVYDRDGPFGACVVTGLSNSRRQVDVADAYERTHVVHEFGS